MTGTVINMNTCRRACSEMHTGKYLEKTHVVLSANVKFLTIFYITNVMGKSHESSLEHVTPKSEEKKLNI